MKSIHFFKNKKNPDPRRLNGSVFSIINVKNLLYTVTIFPVPVLAI